MLASLGAFPALIYHAGGDDRGPASGRWPTPRPARRDWMRRSGSVCLAWSFQYQAYYFDRDVAQKIAKHCSRMRGAATIGR